MAQQQKLEASQTAIFPLVFVRDAAVALALSTKAVTWNQFLDLLMSRNTIYRYFSRDQWIEIKKLIDEAAPGIWAE